MALDKAIDKINVSDTAQEVFIRSSVAMQTIGTDRLEPSLTQGQTLKRQILNVTGNVESITDRVDRTVTSPTDSEESLVVNIYEGVAYSLTKKERIQTNLTGEGGIESWLGGQAGLDLMADFDGKVFGEVENATKKIALNGSSAVSVLASSASSTPITFSAANYATVFAKAGVGLRKNHVAMTDLVTVIDPGNYGVIEAALADKANDVSMGIFNNGFEGRIMRSDVYVSSNLTNEVIVTAAGTIVEDDTITFSSQVSGVDVDVTFTIKDTPSAAGDVDTGASDTATLANLVAAINGGSGAGSTYIELSAANRKALNQLRLTASSDGAVLTVKSNSGELVYAMSLTGVTETANFMHCYYGRRGAVDTVLQMEFDTSVTEETKQPGTLNYFVEYLGGKKLFSDGAKKFVDMHLVTV
jgi:hypothetical protein